ncbi:helix-turn-helix domain-containing protein [Salmonella enterica]|nr:helix-turn-helix domain-containing protein [Salmonella enterica]
MTEKEREIRSRDLLENDKKLARERIEAEKNQNFTQVSPLGWKRLMELAKGNQGAFGLYSFLAQHIDGSCGAVVADQSFLASQFNVTTRTIIRWLNYLEDNRAVVRIPVAGKVCAYALNPNEVWKGYGNTKEYAAFITKTLVNKDGDIQRRIMAMFSGTESSQEQ